MKKLIIAIISLTLLAGVASAISPSIKKVVEQAVTQAVAQAAVTSEAVRLQADDADTTDVAGITPSAVGQILVGQTGVGTNSVWVSVGLTTNDWVKVSAE